ncbi:hypothetical protein QJS10_CPA16g01119 [Acorus calamus]|uniref:Uncharacterized protein n=1 Tax=Acorus calamus TaxID=4465 RepID=A0AAV9D3U1_ACOCL|nr:hypothetical protein QJS10_CPA16g01119 [Acorus calamus]
MAKKKTWFNSLKEIFHSNPKSKSEKEEKRRRWLLGRLKPQPTPALIAPQPPPPSPLGRRHSVKQSSNRVSMHWLWPPRRLRLLKPPFLLLGSPRRL